MMDDNSLVALAQQDRMAFEDLYQRYVVLVYRYCYRIVGDQESAEDATSETFIKALQAIDRFQIDKGSFRSWLFCIAHNAAMDVVRKRRTVTLDEQWERPDTGRLPEDLVIAQDAKHRLRSALRFLPDDQQAIIQMRLSGLSGAEIAEALEKSPQAIKSAQNRAFKRLRTILGYDNAEGYT